MRPGPPPHAVLFDMDGLLIDSERVAEATFLAACATHGIDDVDLAIYRSCIGLDNAGTRQALAEGLGGAFPLEQVILTWRGLYVSHVESQPIPVMPGAVELIGELSAAGIRLAVVTSSQTPRAERKLTLAGLREHFEVVVGADQVATGKPAPDLYLRGLELMGVRAEDCWAVEDSANGVRAAVAAGLRVVQVPDLVTPTAEILAIGHPVVRSLMDARAAMIIA